MSSVERLGSTCLRLPCGVWRSDRRYVCLTSSPLNARVRWSEEGPLESLSSVISQQTLCVYAHAQA